jgi:hypothetical protein
MGTSKVITYDGVEYFRGDSGWIENKVKIIFNRLAPPTHAKEHIAKELEKMYSREEKIKRILKDE